MTKSSAFLPFWVRFILNLLLAIFAFAFILVLAFPIGFYGMAMYITPSLPSVSELKKAKLEMPLQIYTQDDKLVGQYGHRMSLPVTYEEIPKDFINAFLAAEDASFFQHSGISVKGIGRALTEAVNDEEGQTGGSTITMQVAKNYFLSPERTLNRKLTELFLARKLEEQLTKKEILTLYVNKIYLGEGAYGIRAAAKQYYSKSLDKLTLAEMAMLAGLPKAPSKYNPVANPQRALERRNWILGQMLKAGSITQAQYNEAVKTPNELHLYQAKLDKNLPYLAEMARYALVTQYGKEVIDSGWRVRLTIDSRTQEIAERAIKRGLFAYDRRHGWRGAEVHGKDLSKVKVLGGTFYPAKVTQFTQGKGLKATLQDGTEINVFWANMRWATLRHRNANSRYVSGNVVKVDDIIYVTPNADKTIWSLIQVPKVEGSLVSLDPETGALKAAVGGFDFNKSKFNRALQGYRQPGSTIKPLVYASAMEKGFNSNTLVSDGPLRVGSWSPKNSDGRYLGMMPLRTALYLSRNLVSIRVLRSAGIPDTRALLEQFGLNKSQLPTTLSLALGAGEATPLQMATAYAAFANGGHRVQPYFIQQIYDYDNKLLYQANPQQACAICFNQQLEKLNEQSLANYEKQQEAIKKALESGETITDDEEVDDLLDENPLVKDKKPEKKAKTKEKPKVEEKTLTEEEKKQQEEAKELAIQMAKLRLQTYNAGFDTDRLQAPATQYVLAQQAPRILSPRVSYEMANILRDVIQRGTATKARALGRGDIGGKTGTTNKAKDAWFAGIHPTQTTVVWVGFDQPSPLGAREYGGVAALPIWMDFTGKTLKGIPTQWVSYSNRAKSKKQQQETIELTDDGVRRLDAKGNEIKEKPNEKPPQAVAQKRPEEQPEPPPVENTMADTLPANNPLSNTN